MRSDVRILVGTIALAALAFVGFRAVTAGGAATTSAACATAERLTVQGGGHLLDGQEPPVPYNSTPGTSGWHDAGRPRTGIYVDPLTEPQIVTALEVGQVVVAYDPAAIDADDIATLTATAEASRGQITLTPFTGEMGAPVVLNAWGVRQPCEAIDLDALDRFVSEFHGHGPDA